MTYFYLYLVFMIYLHYFIKTVLYGCLSVKHTKTTELIELKIVMNSDAFITGPLTRAVVSFDGSLTNLISPAHLYRVDCGGGYGMPLSKGRGGGGVQWPSPRKFLKIAY